MLFEHAILSQPRAKPEAEVWTNISNKWPSAYMLLVPLWHMPSSRMMPTLKQGNDGEENKSL